jgi:porin
MRTVLSSPAPIALAAVCGLTAAAAAQQGPSDPVPSGVIVPRLGSSGGILPVDDYSGDIWHRNFLIGDINGERTKLANKGFNFEIDWTQSLQWVVSGGNDNATKYGGNFDYIANLDFERMGLIPGGLVRFRAETRYGKSVNRNAGPFTPVNLDMAVPFTDELDKTIPITITNLNYTQYIGTQFAVMAGKFDTLDLDSNEFASGRGTSQFMNSNLVQNAVFNVGMPYSTLGVGAAWFPSKQFDVSVLLANSSDSSTQSGFEDFGDGWLLNAEAHYQYRAGNLPGGVTGGAWYVGNATLTKFGARATFEPGNGLVIPTQSHMWAVYANGWQYVYVKDQSDAPINLNNGRPDRRGIGLFARAGGADDDVNPVNWDVSFGVGGRGMIGGRDNDWFGVGWYYNHIEPGRFFTAAGVDKHSQGLEAFYNFAITPAAMISADLQYVQAAVPGTDAAVVLGARLNIRF